MTKPTLLTSGFPGKSGDGKIVFKILLLSLLFLPLVSFGQKSLKSLEHTQGENLKHLDVQKPHSKKVAPEVAYVNKIEIGKYDELSVAPVFADVYPDNIEDIDGDGLFEAWDIILDIDPVDGSVSDSVYVQLIDDEGFDYGVYGPYIFTGNSSEDNLEFGQILASWFSGLPRDIEFFITAFNNFGADSIIVSFPGDDIAVADSSAPSIWQVYTNGVDLDDDGLYESWDFEFDIDGASSTDLAAGVMINILDDEGFDYGWFGPYNFLGYETEDNVTIGTFYAEWFGGLPRDIKFEFYAENNFGWDTISTLVPADDELIVEPDIAVSPSEITIYEDGVAPTAQLDKVEIDQMVSNKIIVKMAEGISTKSLSSSKAFSSYGVNNIRPLLKPTGAKTLKASAAKSSLYVLELNASGKELLDIIKELNDNPAVVYAEPDFIARAYGVESGVEYVPAEPMYPQQWGLKNTGNAISYDDVLVGTPGCDINAEPAWEVTKGSSSIVVGVLDSGSDIDHPEFAGRIFAGYDFVDDDNIPDAEGDEAHGTACAGIIGAAEDATGVIGVASATSIMPVRVLDIEGSGTYEWIINGIFFAVDNGADIISMSLGGTGYSAALEEAVDYAYANGVPIFAAAGNSDVDLGVTPHYPSSYTNCIAVGALSPCETRTTPESCDGEYWWGSNYGGGIDFYAPGSRIFTTDILGASGYSTDDYTSNFNGTSAATPFAAGVGALILSEYPDLTPDQLRKIMQLSSVDLGEPGVDYEYGYGRINAADALELAGILESGEGFIILNEGLDVLTVSSIEPDASWLTTSVSSLILEPGESEVVELVVDWTGLTSSNVSEITITSDDPDENTVSVIVTAISGEVSDFTMILGDVKVDYESTAIVPISIENDSVLDIEGINLSFTYNDTVVTPTSVELTGGIFESADYSLVPNLTVPGKVSLAISANSIPVNSEGIIGYVSFDVFGDIGEYTDLEITLADVNETKADEVDGSISIIETLYSISGLVKFYADDTPITGITVMLDPMGSTLSSEDGSYSFEDISRGSYMSYINDEPASLSGVGATDASRVARYIVGLVDFDCYQKLAADVTLNSSISGTDASRIARYSVGLITDLNDDLKNWHMLADEIDACPSVPAFETDKVYDPIAADMVDMDFIGVRLGDVTGNWSSASVMSNSVSAPAAFTDVSVDSKSGVELADVMVESGTVKMPVKVSGETNIEGLDLYLANSNVDYTFESAELSSELKSAGYELVSKISGNTIHLVVFAKNKVINPSGEIINLVVKTNIAGNSAIEIREAIMNEVDVKAQSINGTYSTSSPLNNLDTEISSVSVYPNPVSTKLTIDLGSVAESAQRITLLDKSGRIVNSIEIRNSIENSIQFDVSQLPEGDYIYLVSSEEAQLATGRFVIVR